MRRSTEQHTEHTRRAGRTMAVAAMIALAGTVVAGCSDDDDGGAAPATTAETEATTGTDASTSPTEEGGEASAGEQVSVDIVSVSEGFEPSTVTVAAGGEVTWVNTDDVAHTTTAEDGTWDSGDLEAGEEFTFTSDEPGTYPYICSIHPSMKGELVVE